MVGKERSVYSVGSRDELELIVPVLDLSGKFTALFALNHSRNESGGIGKCEIEKAVKSAVEILP